MTQPPTGGAQPDDPSRPSAEPSPSEPSLSEPTQPIATPAPPAPGPEPAGAPTQPVQPAAEHTQPVQPAADQTETVQPAAEPWDEPTRPLGDPTRPVDEPTQAVTGPPPPIEGVAYPTPPPGQAYPGQPAVPKRRGLLIASLVLAIVLVLCGGGGVAAFLLLRNAETGDGAGDPVTAVDRFLTAVYTQQDAEQAAALVCAQARRDRTQIDEKIDEVRGYAETYQNPRFRWDPPRVEEQNEEQASVAVTLTLTTSDERSAQQQLRFLVLNRSGWRVCEVTG